MIAALLLAATGAAATATPASTDVTFDQTTVTTVDGKAGPAMTSRVFWSGRRVRLESGDAFEPLVLLVDFERDRAYRIDPAARTATRLDADALRARAHLGFAIAGDRLGSTAGSFRPQGLPGTRTIAGHACRGYRLRGGETRVDVWLAEGLPLDMADFAEVLEWSGAAAALGALLPELERLAGFPLETRSRVTADGHVYETRATVTRITRAPLDAALFDPPPTYRLESEAEPEP